MTTKVVSPLPINKQFSNSSGILKPEYMSTVAVAAGYSHSLFIFENKGVFCFGVLSSDLLACSGHGNCTSVDRCRCDHGYIGDNCEVVTCFGFPSAAFPNHTGCSSHGECVAVDRCECDPGRTGTQCELNVCFSKSETDPLVCSGHGYCVSPGVCICDMGYNGTQCETPQCFGQLSNDSMVCSGHGYCVALDQCICDTGYSGTQCEVPQCYGIAAPDRSVLRWEWNLYLTRLLFLPGRR